MRRGLIAIYLVTLAALTAVGWVDALRRGVPGYLTGNLWLALFVAILVEQAVLEKATRGLFRLRADVLDERQRAVRDRGYRYGFRILAVAATATAVAAAPTGSPWPPARPSPTPGAAWCSPVATPSTWSVR